MKKRLIRLGIAAAIGLAILAAGVWFLARLLGNGQKYYHGKTVSQWAIDLHSADSQVRAQAADGVDKFVVPPLIDVMLHDTNDSQLRLKLAQSLSKLPGISIGFASAFDRRRSATQILGGLGPAARSATPVLIQAAKSSDAAVSGEAVRSLGQIHDQPDAVIPLLIVSLDKGDFTQNAAVALGEYGPQAKGAVSNLEALLKVPDQDKHVRNAVLGALKKIDPDEATKAANIGHW